MVNSINVFLLEALGEKLTYPLFYSVVPEHVNVPGFIFDIEQIIQDLTQSIHKRVFSLSVSVSGVAVTQQTILDMSEQILSLGELALTKFDDYTIEYVDVGELSLNDQPLEGTDAMLYYVNSKVEITIRER